MILSRDRILTTLAGSLPRPDDLVDLLLAQDEGKHDAGALKVRVRTAVSEVVARQVECGIDIVSDGEMSKISYVNYLKHRIDGFGDPAPLEWSVADIEAHPGYGATLGGPLEKKSGNGPPACRGALKIKDRSLLDEDLDNFQAAVSAAPPQAAFMNAASPGVVAQFMPNKFYPNDEAYIDALGEVLREEYEAIVAAGFQVQLDCPDLAMGRHMVFADKPLDDFRARARYIVEIINHATRNIPPEAMRLHICWGNYPGPHTHDVPVADIADIIFQVRPQYLLFEGANPRHAHEWEEWATLDIPEDKVLVPGMIDTNSNHVEHPSLIAQRLGHYADIVGRERVIAGTDCGFATLASLPRVWPSIAWEKLRALADGAALASERLWSRVRTPAE
jgi:5-methyltetrahydropteroyltriglutamate--homocysteine methyltransferase